MRRVLILLLLVLLLSGCARVPSEVKEAMEKQAEELSFLKEKHRESVDLLFAEIRALQLSILNTLEEQFQKKYARGAKAVKLADGKTAVIYTDPEKGSRLPPTGDPDVDVIAISTNRVISEWFSAKRAEAEEKLLKTKKEFLRLEDHIEIAERINEAVTEYLDSQEKMRRAQKKLGKTLIGKVKGIPGAGSIEGALISLLVPDTNDLEAKLGK